MSSDNKPFVFVDRTGGQVWRTRLIDDQVFACHNSGLFIADKGVSRLVYKDAGMMDVAHFEGTDYYLFSSYVGVLLMKKVRGHFQFVENLDLWWNPQLVYDKKNNCIWAGLNNNSVVKLRLEADHSVKKERFDDFTTFFNTGIGLVFYNEKDFFVNRMNHFIPYENRLINHVRGSKIVALDINSSNNLIACIQEGKVRLAISLPDGTIHSYDKLLSSLGSSLVKGNEHLDISGSLLRVATDRGVVVFDTDHQSEFQKSTLPVVSSVSVLSEPKQKLFLPFADEGVFLPVGDKDLKLSFGIESASSDVVEFRYRMSSLQEDWTEWDEQTRDVLYTQVKGGSYRFYLQSRINDGSIEEYSLALSIDRKWYQTPWVILPIVAFVLLWMLGIVYVMSRINRNKLKKQHSKFRQKDAEKTVALKNEQLLQYTEIISRKNEFLNQVKAGLEKMRNNDAQLWVKRITNEVSNEKKDFLFHKLFSEIHQDFISRVTEQYPALTSNDIRLLSFIRINLDSREVANLMNISIKSVDTNRYRLRKKLELSHETDLNQFVRDF